MNLLSRIRAQYVFEAIRTLPACENAKETFMEAKTEVPDFGTVLFCCERLYHRHGKSSYWFWCARAAVLEDDVVEKRRDFGGQRLQRAIEEYP